ALLRLYLDGCHPSSIRLGQPIAISSLVTSPPSAARKARLAWRCKPQSSSIHPNWPIFPDILRHRARYYRNQEKETAMTVHAIGFAFYLATNAILIAVALLVATPATAAEFQRYPQPNNRPDHIAV